MSSKEGEASMLRLQARLDELVATLQALNEEKLVIILIYS